MSPGRGETELPAASRANRPWTRIGVWIRFVAVYARANLRVVTEVGTF
jgi:hypothetical protein